MRRTRTTRTEPAGGASSVTVRPAHLVVATIGLVVAATGSLFVGVTELTPAGLLRGDDDQLMVLWESRLPRLLAVLLAGSALSVAGLIMMSLTRNRFVTPSTAGTAESAALGVLVATVFFGAESVGVKMLVATAFALAGTYVFVLILRRLTFADIIVVPLVGIMFGGVLGAVTTFFAYRADLLQTVTAWTSGEFSGVLQGRYELLWITGGLTVLGYLYADRFTLAGLGRDFAVNLGVRYDRVVTIGLVLVSAMTAVIVVTVGNIPFLGLVVPNLVTLLLGDNLRRVLPVTALGGAFFVLVCDVLGRTVRYPYEVPVETIAGVLGGGVFLVLVLRARRGNA
nr:ABC transporter permease [Saccharomonospora iraqiensis]